MKKINKNILYLGLIGFLFYGYAQFRKATFSLEPSVQDAVNSFSNQKGKAKVKGIKPFVEGEVLVKFKDGSVNLRQTMGKIRLTGLREANNLSSVATLEENNVAVLKSESKSTQNLIDELKKEGDVEYVEPNYLHAPLLTPNDSLYAQLWGYHNSGQTVEGVAGTNDEDIDGPEAWDIENTLTSQSEVVVAVIDTGVAYNHPDLAGNMWDGSSCKSDTGAAVSGGCPNHGWDYQHNDNDPYDDMEHGTHVAGTIAAIANNSKGVIGASSKNKIKIMALKVGDENGFSSAAIVKAINFAKHNGAKVINASYGGSGISTAERDAVQNFPGLFVAAAGNDSSDNDTVPKYPTNLGFPNMVSVASIANSGNLSDFSNYGATKVNVAAPGSAIKSTVHFLQMIDFEEVTPPAVGSNMELEGTGAWTVVNNTSGTNKMLLSPRPGNNGSVALKTGLNLPAGKKSKLSFIYSCPMVSSSNYMVVEVFDGSSWREVDTINLSGYNLKTYDVTNYNNANFKYRFRWVTTSPGSNSYYCIVDDIAMSSEGSNGQLYKFLQGTSMATPHVSGLAGLVWSVNPNLTTAQVRTIVMESGDSSAKLAGKISTGKRVSLKNAIQAAKDSLGSGTAPTLTPTLTPTPGASQPTATLTPTQTQTQPSATPVPGSCTKTCTDKNKGNAHIGGQCNSSIDIEDFNAWKTEFLTYRANLQTKNDWNADFNCDGKVNMADYGVWLRGYMPKEAQ